MTPYRELFKRLKVPKLPGGGLCGSKETQADQLVQRRPRDHKPLKIEFDDRASSEDKSDRGNIGPSGGIQLDNVDQPDLE